MLQFGTAILIGILLAKSGLPTGQISVYEALLFVASLFCFFWIVGGQNALLQLFPKLNEETRARAIFNIYFLFSVLGIITATILFLTKNFINLYLTSFGDLPFLDLLAVFLLFNCPTFLIQYYYLLLKKFNAIVVYGAISFSLQLLVVIGPIYLGMTLREVMFGLIFWAIFKYVWGIIVVIKYGTWKYDVAFLKIYFPIFWPLLLFGLVGKGSDYVSGLVVTTLFSDENAFAIFRYGAREFPLAVLMVGALASSMIPEVAANAEKGMQRIKESTQRLSRWLYPISFVSILASPFIFPIVFNADFKESAYIFNIFTLLLMSRILLPQVVAMGHQKNYILTVAALVEMALIVALSWWWGGLFGLRGVAYATAVAFMTDRLILIFYNWKVLNIPPQKYIHLKSYLIYNLLLVVFFFISLSF
ncbi:MAG: hypothetical protein AAFZ15_20105 [Bacteroidota bacterium]